MNKSSDMKMVTVYEFVLMLIENLDENYEFEKGYTDGWIEEIDLVNKDKYIDKKTVARIVHMFLKKIMLESDEINWESAKKLVDLYDCRVCVNHVAQVYEKGIVDASVNDKNRPVFGMQDSLVIDDVKHIIDRVYNKAARNRHRDSGNLEVVNNAIFIGYEEALAHLEKFKNRADSVIILDVRNYSEYILWHIEDAVNITITDALDGKLDVSSEVREIYVYCDNGYKSEVVANYFADKLDFKIYYFGLKKMQ